MQTLYLKAQMLLLVLAVFAISTTWVQGQSTNLLRTLKDPKIAGHHTAGIRSIAPMAKPWLRGVRITPSSSGTPTCRPRPWV